MIWQKARNKPFRLVVRVYRLAFKNHIACLSDVNRLELSNESVPQDPDFLRAETSDGTWRFNFL